MTEWASESVYVGMENGRGEAGSIFPLRISVLHRFFKWCLFLCFLDRSITRFNFFPLSAVTVVVSSVLPVRWAAVWLGCLEALLTTRV